MAFPQSSMGLVPWMNARASDPAGLPSDTVISFPIGGNIIVKWLEDGTYTNNQFYLQNLGRWGTDLPNDYHYTVAIIASTYPGTTNYTVANRTALLSLAGMQEYNTALVTSDNSYWEYLESKWIRIIQKVNIGTTTAYSITATIFTATFPLDDLAKVLGIGIKEGGYYDLCWNGNGLHATVYDATFNVSPVGYRIYDEIPDRTELNTRVAGEKGLYEDEFVTASQLEAGTGITIKYRNIDGSLTGYTTDTIKGGNIVFESSGISGIHHQAAIYPFSNANIYYDETTSIIRFQDERNDYLDTDIGYMANLPIKFELVKDIPNNIGIIRAHAINNNLHFSLTKLNTVNEYAMVDAGFTDYTVNHIRFVDTPNLTWNIFGTVMPTYVPPGLTVANRQGIVITPQLNGLYVNWNVKSGNPDVAGSGEWPGYGQSLTYTVDSQDTLEFLGRNSVRCTLVGIQGNLMRVEIDRPLYVSSAFGGQNEGNTSSIRFENNLGTDDASISSPVFWNREDSNLKYYSEYTGQYGGYRAGVNVLPVAFTATKYAGGESRERQIRGFTPRNDLRWASQWAADYAVPAPANLYRTLTNANGILQVGFWGWGTEGATGASDITPAPGSEINVIASYNQYNPTTNIQNTAPTAPLGLVLNYEEGLYYVSFTVQGLMGMFPGITAQFNPLISQAVHLHLVTDPFAFGNEYGSLNGKVLQSLDIMRDYNYIPLIQNAAGQDSHTLYRRAVNSRPWSMQGGGLYWLRGMEEIFAMLTYNPGQGNTDFFYQVCYVKAECFRVSNTMDMKFGKTINDVDSNPTTYNYAPQRWHDMNFY